MTVISITAEYSKDLSNCTCPITFSLAPSIFICNGETLYSFLLTLPFSLRAKPHLFKISAENITINRCLLGDQIKMSCEK